MAAVLETRGLTVDFGGLRALDGVDISVPRGGLVGLIGSNGAGKTTFIDAVTGFVPASGSVLLDGEELGRRAPHQRARRGLVRTWQATELFDDLTVAENLQVAAERHRVVHLFGDLLRPRPRAGGAEAERALELLGIEHLAERMPGELSHGQRKLAGVARSLATEPRLLCLDEPAAGLDPAECRQLGERLRRVVESGVTILLVDHDMGLVLSLCDEVHVVEFGRLIAHGTPAEIRADEKVIASYLGTRSSSGSGGDPKKEEGVR
jgi:branched-chain amino acid transport system ATP-binding protein